MARDLSRHHQARREKTTACARIPLRTRNGPSCHRDPPAGVHSKYWKSHTTTIFLFFLMFEVRFLHADPHRFVLLISLFHQMKGMPWMSTPSPFALGPRIRCYPGKRGGGSPGNLGRGVPLGSPNPHFPHPYACSDQASKLHTCCKTWSLGRIMSSEIRAQTKNS